MKVDQEQISNLTLLLIYLSSWEEKVYDGTIRRAWKGYDFGILNDLDDRNYISQGKKAKSMYLTEEGIKKAEQLLTLLEQLK